MLLSRSLRRKLLASIIGAVALTLVYQATVIDSKSVPAATYGVAGGGGRLTGGWEQPHTRAWSSTIRFETTEGRVWFKVNGSGTAHEAGLVALLGELRPGLAPDELVRAHKAEELLDHCGPAGRVSRQLCTDVWKLQ